MLKAIIIDDEEAALRSLELLIQSYCPSISVVAMGQSVKEGLDLIKKHNPDIVFLDIEMPHGNGFELIEQSPSLNFEVIFITAYNQYAIKAFKYSAIDYILKPVDPEELISAVDKVIEQKNSQISPRERYAALFENIKEILPRKLVIPHKKEFKYIELSNVLHLKTSEALLKFTMKDGSELEIQTGTTNVEELLVEKGFLSIENGYMINLNKIIKVEKSGSGTIIFEGNHTISLESYSKDLLIEKLMAYNKKLKV